MGAMQFTQTVRGGNASDAFSVARAEAHFDHGHGYTGSIGEKEAFLLIEEARDGLMEPAAWELANKLLDSNDPRISCKWGEAGYIPISEGGKVVKHLFFGWASS